MRWSLFLSVCFPIVSITFSFQTTKSFYKNHPTRLPPISPIVKTSVHYNPELAEFALDFAAATYATNPTGCLAKHNATLIKRATVPCDYFNNECWAYIAQSAEWIIMAVRGTQEKRQLLVELFDSVIAPKVSFPIGGKVQHYFNYALDVLWNDSGFGAILKNLQKSNPNVKMLFTGHSFGGAIASLASALFVYKNKNTIKPKDAFSITFGQPRVGNYDYAMAHDRIVPNSWRLVHKLDIVPHVPLCLAWKHKCTFGMNLTPYHHGTEIWYPDSDNATTYRTCTNLPLNEDASCSNRFSFGFNIGDHEFYLGKDVSRHGNTNCALSNLY